METKIKAIIVDDEESARSVLNNLLQRYCPNVIVVDKFSNVEDAVKGINQINPDVVFLDIEMPNYAGYEIVNFFNEINFEIIFITAYDKYAIKAFEVSAVDYLLKPIDIDRLKISVNKLTEKIKNKKGNENYKILTNTLQSNEIKNIIFNEKGSQIIIETENIIAIEAQESYSMIYTNEKKHIVSKNLKHFENVLKENLNFIRTHKSWIINTNNLIKYTKSKLELELDNGLIAKLSKYKKSEFEELIY